MRQIAVTSERGEANGTDGNRRYEVNTTTVDT